jgi:hypothetical protein
MPAASPVIAVDGKTLRGSRTRNSTARHVLATADQHTGVILASTDVARRPMRSPASPRCSTGWTTYARSS